METKLCVLCRQLFFPTKQTFPEHYPQVCMATDNLFWRCIQNSTIAHAKKTSTLAQLEVIGSVLSDLIATCDAHLKPRARTPGGPVLPAV